MITVAMVRNGLDYGSNGHQALVVAEVFKRREIPSCDVEREGGEFGLIRMEPRGANANSGEVEECQGIR